MAAESTASRFPEDGAQRFKGTLTSELDPLAAALDHLPRGEAGVRIRGIEYLNNLLAPRGSIGAIAANILGPDTRAVRAILFNKTSKANWSLGWHQDRTICVKERRLAPTFGPWTTKSGMQHVEPPFALLTRMVTVRVHLDDVSSTNAPLLIAPGSHAFGRVRVGEIDEVVRECGTRACLAEAGDVWLYATPIIHASMAATAPSSRRVLQVDFATDGLPHGLEWLGV